MGDRFKMLRVYFSMQLSPHKMEAVAEEDVFTFSQTAVRQVRYCLQAFDSCLSVCLSDCLSDCLTEFGVFGVLNCE